jgi:hypothetical protein
MSARDSQMPRNEGAKIKKEIRSWIYEAHLTPDMAGDWSVDLSYKGPQGTRKAYSPSQR